MIGHQLVARLVLAVLVGAACGSVASAQTVVRFEDLPLRLDVGDTVTVTDVDGAGWRGPVTGLWPDAIVLRLDQGDVTFDAHRVRSVGRCCDRLWDGPLIGMVSMSAVGLVAARNMDSSDREFEIVSGAMLGLLGGFFFDLVNRTDRTIYRAPETMAWHLVADSHGGRVLVAFRW